MIIHNTVVTQEFRCPRCGNRCFPDKGSAPVIICPVIGCHQVIDPSNMPLMLPDPDAGGYDTAARTDNSDAPLLYERDENGDMIITGVRGNPTELTIPAMFNGRAVMAVAPGAFQGCQSLRRVTLPDTVAVIGESAFENCSELKQIVFGAGLTLLDKNALRNCRSLDQATLPAKVHEVGRSAFEGCTGLQHLLVQGRVKIIRDNAFLDCDHLSRITFDQPAARVADSAFSGCCSLPDQLLLSFCPQNAQ